MIRDPHSGVTLRQARAHGRDRSRRYAESQTCGMKRAAHAAGQTAFFFHAHARAHTCLRAYLSARLHICRSRARICVCPCLCLRVSVCCCVSLCVSVCRCVYLCVSLCVSVSLSVSLCVSVFISAYACLCVCVCVPVVAWRSRWRRWPAVQPPPSGLPPGWQECRTQDGRNAVYYLSAASALMFPCARVGCGAARRGVTCVVIPGIGARNDRCWGRVYECGGRGG